MWPFLEMELLYILRLISELFFLIYHCLFYMLEPKCLHVGSFKVRCLWVSKYGADPVEPSSPLAAPAQPWSGLWAFLCICHCPFGASFPHFSILLVYVPFFFLLCMVFLGSLDILDIAVPLTFPCLAADLFFLPLRNLNPRSVWEIVWLCFYFLLRNLLQ